MKAADAGIPCLPLQTDCVRAVFGSVINNQQFVIDCEQVTETESRSLLPKVLDGHGCGIMDDVDGDTLRQMIDRAERDEGLSLPYPAKRKKWIWNSFDADKANAVLKREISRIRKGYLEDEDE